MPATSVTRHSDRIDTVLALIDECLAQYERTPTQRHDTARSQS